MFFSRFIFISSDWDGTNVIGMEMGMEMGNENRKVTPVPGDDSIIMGATAPI